MAVPVVAIVKAAVAVLSNEKTRKAVGWIIAAILSPIILIIVVICALMSGTADHNAAAVDLTFHGGSITAQAPPEYRQYIKEMRGCFDRLDGAVAEIMPLIESGSIDTTRMKAIFYALFFGAENPNMDFKTFADCFVRYEERTCTVTDEDGNESEETYTAAVPIQDLATIYAQLEAALGRATTEENRVNAAQIYSRVLYGFASPDDFGISEDEWLGGVFDGEIYTGGGDFASPLGAGWRTWSPLNSVGEPTPLAAVVARGTPDSTWERPRVRPSKLPEAASSAM